MPTKKPSSKKSTKTASSPVFPWLKSYPQNIQWDIDIPEKPLWALMDEAAAAAPDKNCIDFLGKKYTYGQISNLVNRVAEGLQKIGVKQGTKVGIFMPNAPHFVIAYFAILKAGGVVVNYNPLYADHEITHQINDSETEIIITLDLQALCTKLIPLLGSTTLKKMVVCSVAESLPFPKNILFKLFKRSEIAKLPINPAILNFNDLINNAGQPKAIKIDPKKDVALLQYTGGTTGIPKGAMLSHYNVYANAIQAHLWFVGMEYGKDKILAGLPLFHVYAMTAVMTLAILTASEIVMMFPRFNPFEAMKLIEKHKITFFPGVPTMYSMIAYHPKVKNIDLNSLKACLSGGAPLPIKIKEDFESLTGCKLVEAYGLSETSPAAIANPAYGVNKAGSIGIPFPRTEVKIVSLDDSSHSAERHINGQIAIKGPQVMLGYWNRPSDTKKVFASDFFLTGDVGYMDEDGYTFLVDRIKDLIICSGFNVYPRMVEDVIYRHPAVAEVIVIGVPDEKRGETVKAFVKLKENMILTEEKFLEFLRDKLSPIEMPKYIEFRDELPKTMIGKLSKKELKAEENSKKRI
ncbi:AMP-dependent synthetase [Candidatus Paracaedibacter acanthamoebae]|uniref:AMP-dependent synthetase n=2 Tax=Candidatus Odyssella acanthamoebae TaxID=91604 RepID=A0A077AXT7_9PROT|nr:AMP-dependent synthetase [Candidatus Paracaedibacter acanthamoebae]